MFLDSKNMSVILIPQLSNRISASYYNGLNVPLMKFLRIFRIENYVHLQFIL